MRRFANSCKPLVTQAIKLLAPTRVAMRTLPCSTSRMTKMSHRIWMVTLTKPIALSAALLPQLRSQEDCSIWSLA